MDIIVHFSDSEGPTNKTIIFTKYRERHCVVVLCMVVFPKALRFNLHLLRTFPADEGMNIRSEFLPDVTKIIMNEIKMVLMVKYF
jgi:hypothetical protein